MESHEYRLNMLLMTDCSKYDFPKKDYTSVS
jgi:hypothetical protein